ADVVVTAKALLGKNYEAGPDGKRTDAPPVGLDGDRQDPPLAEERRRRGQEGRAAGRDRERQGQYRGGGLRLGQAEQDRRSRRRERPDRRGHRRDWRRRRGSAKSG